MKLFEDFLDDIEQRDGRSARALADDVNTDVLTDYDVNVVIYHFKSLDFEEADRIRNNITEIINSAFVEVSNVILSVRAEVPEEELNDNTRQLDPSESDDASEREYQASYSFNMNFGLTSPRKFARTVMLLLEVCRGYTEICFVGDEDSKRIESTQHTGDLFYDLVYLVYTFYDIGKYGLSVYHQLESKVKTS